MYKVNERRTIDFLIQDHRDRNRDLPQEAKHLGRFMTIMRNIEEDFNKIHLRKLTADELKYIVETI